MKKPCQNQSGQVLTEYAAMLVMCAFVALSLAGLLYYFGEYGNRLIDMVCIGCP